MLGIKEIQEILPHRHPFLLVDKIEELVPGERAVGYKAVTYDEQFFRGHFPGEPVMPGVLMIEALAQVGAVAILSMDENKGKTAYFGAINSAKFKRKVVPGDVLNWNVKLSNEKARSVSVRQWHLWMESRQLLRSLLLQWVILNRNSRGNGEKNDS